MTPATATTLTLNRHHFLPPPHPHPHPLLTSPSPFHYPNRLRLRSTSSSDSSIFLPHLRHQHQHQHQPHPERQADADDSDPILRFFRDRSSSSDPDPPIESKLSLQRNRRTSWRLSPTISSTHYPDPPTETPSTVDFPADDEDGDDLIGTVAGEVMRIARELPDNMTIGEALEGFQGGKKLTHWECLEVLKQMEKHAMVGCALYFFEWMMMQVPSPISGKACSVFFGVLTINLGKWGFMHVIGI